MVTCSRRNAKSTWGRAARSGWAAGLTGGGAGSTVEVAVVTTFPRACPACGPRPSRWRRMPAAPEAVVVAGAGVSLGSSQGKCFSSKGRSVFQTAKTRWSSLRMQWPMATSPRLPLALRRR